MLPDKIDSLIVVEGFKGAMWLVQNGFHNVVATMGKGVTQIQEGLLASMRVPIVIMFDADEAGRNGAESLGINLYRSGVSVSYAYLDDGLSPDDLTCGQITTALAEALPHLRRKKADGKLDATSPILPETKTRTHGRRRKQLPV